MAKNVLPSVVVFLNEGLSVRNDSRRKSTLAREDASRLRVRFANRS